MSERERAEQLVNDIHSRVDRDGELDEYWHGLCVGDVLAFAREERARGLEEVIKLCKEHQEKGAVAQNHWYLLKLKNQLEKRIKMLREEGGRGTD